MHKYVHKSLKLFKIKENNYLILCITRCITFILTNITFFCLTNLIKQYIIYRASEKQNLNGGVKMKRIYQPNNHRKSKKMGFMARMKTNIINNRRKKGRKVLSH